MSDLTTHAAVARQALEQLLPPTIGAAVFLFEDDDAGGTTITFLTNRDRMVSADIVEEWLDHSVYAGQPLAAALKRIRDKLREEMQS